MYSYVDEFKALCDADYVRKPVVLGLTGYSAAGLEQQIAAGKFPSPKRLRPGSIVWRVGNMDPEERSSLLYGSPSTILGWNVGEIRAALAKIADSGAGDSK